MKFAPNIPPGQSRGRREVLQHTVTFIGQAFPKLAFQLVFVNITKLYIMDVSYSCSDVYCIHKWLYLQPSSTHPYFSVRNSAVNCCPSGPWIPTHSDGFMLQWSKPVNHGIRPQTPNRWSQSLVLPKVAVRFLTASYQILSPPIAL